MAFSYYTTFTVNPGQVPSAQTDFPVLLLPTDTRFKNTALGGHVQNINGFDLRPYADSSHSTAYVFELVPNTYNQTTGFFEMWVKVPSATNGSVIYLFYGDPTINTNGSSTATWDSDFALVYHFPNGSVLDASDSTANARNGTIIVAAAVAGQIDGGVLGGGGDDMIRTPAFSAGAVTQTLELWANCATFSSQAAGFINHEPVNGESLLFMNGGSLSLRGGSASGIVGVAPSDNNWHHLAGTFPAPNTGIIYVDGAVLPTTLSLNTPIDDAHVWDIGGIHSGASFAYTGSLDEVRISKIARSADWIATEYNNQVNPGNFYTIGAEQVVSSSTGFAAKQFIGEIQYLGVDSFILDSSMGVN